MRTILPLSKYFEAYIWTLMHFWIELCVNYFGICNRFHISFSVFFEEHSIYYNFFYIVQGIIVFKHCTIFLLLDLLYVCETHHCAVYLYREAAWRHYYFVNIY